MRLFNYLSVRIRQILNQPILVKTMLRQMIRRANQDGYHNPGSANLSDPSTDATMQTPRQLLHFTGNPDQPLVIKDLLVIVSGLLIYASSANWSLNEGMISAGGFTGLGQLIRLQLKLPLSLCVLILSGSILGLMWRKLGIRLALLGLLSTLSLSLFLALTSQLHAVFRLAVPGSLIWLVICSLGQAGGLWLVIHRRGIAGLETLIALRLIQFIMVSSRRVQLKVWWLIWLVIWLIESGLIIYFSLIRNGLCNTLLCSVFQLIHGFFLAVSIRQQLDLVPICYQARLRASDQSSGQTSGKSPD